MTIKQIQKFHQSVPFRPFYLRLANGHRLLVDEPENLGYSVKGHTLSVFASQDVGDLIDVRDVTAIQEYAPQRNGEKRR